jgi:hypothetical protein
MPSATFTALCVLGVALSLCVVLLFGLSEVI